MSSDQIEINDEDNIQPDDKRRRLEEERKTQSDNSNHNKRKAEISWGTKDLKNNIDF